MKTAPSLHHLLARTAAAFGVSERPIRGHGRHGSIDARLAFCRLAVTVGGCDSPLVIGMTISRDAVWVEHALAAASARVDVDRAFAERLRAIELECLAEIGVSARTHFPLPHARDPRATAEALVSSPRDAMAVGIADLAALGAAYLALENNVARSPLVSKDL